MMVKKTSTDVDCGFFWHSFLLVLIENVDARYKCHGSTSPFELQCTFGKVCYAT